MEHFAGHLGHYRVAVITFFFGHFPSFSNKMLARGYMWCMVVGGLFFFFSPDVFYEKMTSLEFPQASKREQQYSR